MIATTIPSYEARFFIYTLVTVRRILCSIAVRFLP